MSELKPSSGGSGTSDWLVRTRGLKKQDTANEERVSSNGILFQADYFFVFFTQNWLLLLQATELFLRAVKEEQNGAFYEGMFIWWSIIQVTQR